MKRKQSRAPEDQRESKASLLFGPSDHANGRLGRRVMRAPQLDEEPDEEDPRGNGDGTTSLIDFFH